MRGRPTKYTSDLVVKLIEAMDAGKSVERFCRDIRIHKDTFYEWVKKYDDFADAFRYGKTFCEAYWEEWLLKNLDNKNANAGLVKLFMTNRFGWKDKNETISTITIKPEILEAKEYIKSRQKDI